MEASCPSCRACCHIEDVGTSDVISATCTSCALDFLIRRAPSRIWVLADDPALRGQALRSVLQEVGEETELSFLSTRRRAEIASAVCTDRLAPPEVLVFGDMHVLLADPVLSALGSAPDVRRVLISTHYNAELLQEAESFCRVSTHVVLPATPQGVVERVRGAILLEAYTSAPSFVRNAP